MPKRGCRCLLLVAAAWLAAAAPEAPAGSLDSLFEAADRGELAPVSQALATTGDAETRTLLRARLAAARFDLAAARDPALARLASGDDPAERRASLSVMASVAFSNGDYAEAARTSRLLEQALTEAGNAEDATAAGHMRGVAELLAGHPSQQVEGEVVPGSIAAHYDRVGLPRVEVAVNGQAQEAVVDTGANLSVLSRDTARRLGIEIAEAETRVGNGVEGTVPVRVVVAERLEIAGTLLRNVPFLIIDDAQLTFPLPGGYDIRAIIGLPVLRALGRIRIENEGRFAVLPAAGAAGSESNLHASGNDLFVDVGDRRPECAAPSRHRRQPDLAQRALCHRQSGCDRRPPGRREADGERGRDAACVGRDLAGCDDRARGADPGPAVPAGESAGGRAGPAILRHARLERAAGIPELHDRLRDDASGAGRAGGAGARGRQLTALHD